MKSNMIAKWVMCFFSVAVILCAAQVAWAQAEDGERQSGAIEDSNSRATISSDEQLHKPGQRAQRISHSQDSIYEGTGWLIHDGQLIPGPYDVVVEDSIILVNNQHIYPRPRPIPKDTTEIDPDIRAISKLSDRFWDILPIWIDSLGRDGAFQRAVEFMLSQEIVDTAYLTANTGTKGPADMRVSYNVGTDFEIPFDLDSYRNMITKSETEGWYQSHLLKRAREIDYLLSHTGLVFSQNGTIRWVRAPRGKSQLAEIKAILGSTTDNRERVTAIRDIVIDKEIAEAIARNFLNE